MAIEVVFEKRINNVTVYRDVDIVQRRQHYLLTCLALLFGMGLLFYGWQQYRWIQLGYEMEILQKQKGELFEHQKELILEHAYLGRDERIDKIARNELGMVTASPEQIVMWWPEESSPASPDEAAAPLSAANLSGYPAIGDSRRTEDSCSENESQLSTSGGGSAERCQEAR